MAVFGMPGGPEIWIIAILCLPVWVVVAIVLAANAGRRRTGQYPMQAAPVPAGWFADPTGRHQLRYWDGAAWTAFVADAGIQTEDPL